MFQKKIFLEHLITPFCLASLTFIVFITFLKKTPISKTITEFMEVLGVSF